MNYSTELNNLLIDYVKYTRRSVNTVNMNIKLFEWV